MACALELGGVIGDPLLRIGGIATLEKENIMLEPNCLVKMLVVFVIL